MKIHLAKMDARSAWERFEPRVQEIEHQVEEAAGLAARAVEATLADLKRRLGALREEIARPDDAS